MLNFPSELITLLGSSFLAGCFRLWSFTLSSRQQERMNTLEYFKITHGIQSKAIHQARKYSNPGFQWTRRAIALTAVFFIIAFPKIVSVWMPEITVHIGYPQITKGFMFFTSDAEKIKWVQMQGLVITPLDTHLLSAIVGLYFGSSIIHQNN